MFNAFMLSCYLCYLIYFVDGFETEPSLEPNENENESITAIKFEIEYGQENNCFFDSTQDSF